MNKFKERAIKAVNNKQIYQENSRKTKGEEKCITVTIEESQGKIHSKGKYGREGKPHALKDNIPSTRFSIFKKIVFSFV